MATLKRVLALKDMIIGRCHIRVQHIMLRRLSKVVDKCSEEFFKQALKRPIVVFMKGVPTSPMLVYNSTASGTCQRFPPSGTTKFKKAKKKSDAVCGFSRMVVQILEMHGVSQFDVYDVLEDQDFKEAVKQHSNWPTFPQVYLNGELIGGADVLLQMHQSGDFAEELKKIGHASTLLQDTPPQRK